MLSEEDFINSVWNKYENYKYTSKNKNKFFSKKLYRNNKYILAIKSFITFLISLTTTIGAVYAGVVTYNYIQKNGKTNYYDDMNSFFEITDQEIYYKKINSYNEYLKYKEKWPSIITMTENDFKDNFIVVLVATWRMPDINISDINTDENTLFINVDNNLEETAIKNENYMVSTCLSNNFDRKNIVVKIKEEKLETSKFILLENLPKEYSIKEATNDLCVVVQDNKILNETKQYLDNFISNTSNGVDDYLRIVRYETTNSQANIIISDIQYKNNEYILYTDYTRDNSSNVKDIRYIGKYKSFGSKPFQNNMTMFFLSDIFGNTVPVIICLK